MNSATDPSDSIETAKEPATTGSKKTVLYDVTPFVHRGRTRKIFRRTPQGNYGTRKTVDGKPTWKCFDTPLANVAISAARGWLDAITQCEFDKKWERLDPVRSRSAMSTIGEVVARYLKRAPDAAKIEKKTATANAGCFRQLLRIALDEPEPDQLRADVLTEATIRRFLERASAVGRNETSARSLLLQARAVLSAPLIYIYDGLRLPDLSGFRVPIKFDTGKEIGFKEIPPAVIAAMETAATALRSADPATWLVYMLMSRLGARNVELEAATLDWLQQGAGGEWYLQLPETKGGNDRLLQLPADLPVEVIREIAVTVEDVERHLVPARNASERKIICYRTINMFVRRFLPDREKAAYELRKWAGSLVWSTQDSRTAQKFLGHRSIGTTERYYARDLRPVRAVSAADRASIYGVPPAPQK